MSLVSSSGIVASRISVLPRKETWFSSDRKLPRLQNMKAFTTQEITLADRLFGWWYRIAAPSEVPDEAPLRLRMRVRSGRLMSVVFLSEIILVLIFAIGCFITHDLVTALAATMALVAIVIGTSLNRMGKTVTAGILILVAEEMGVIACILLTDREVNAHLVAQIFFFLAPELIAAEMITPWVTFPVTLGNCLITAGMIAFFPKTPEVMFSLHAYFYVIYGAPIVMQMLVAVICFLWVSSTYKEMRRANSAEEVSKLTLAMGSQQQVLQQQKQQLEANIQQIVSVHLQAANGNLQARVPLDQQNVLWPVAGSLNNLLARLQRWRYDAVQHQQNQQALQQLLQNIQMARRQGKPLQAYTTGTSLDAVILEISKWTSASQPGTRETASFEPSSDASS